MQLDLKNLLANNAFSGKDKVLLLLVEGDESPRAVSKLRQLAVDNGLRGAKTINFSNFLARLDGLAIKLPTGWTATDEGKKYLRSLGVGETSPSQSLQPALRSYVAGISDEKVKEFVTEAIEALEFKLFRAAVVLSWVGAVCVLFEFVLQKHLAAFNAEALRLDAKWKAATTREDMTRMKEHAFLQIIAALSIIGKNTKDELEVCLKLRNTCGHPNSHRIGEHRVAGHVETLILNVFSQFPI